MMTATSLDLFQEKESKAKPSAQFEADVIRTMKQLAALNQRWAKVADVLDYLGIPVTATTKRRVRKVVEKSPAMFVTGNRGMCLLQHAEPSEVQRAVRRLRKHGEKEIARSLSLERAYHRFGSL